jgi:hypothetical protein
VGIRPVRMVVYWQHIAVMAEVHWTPDWYISPKDTIQTQMQLGQYSYLLKTTLDTLEETGKFQSISLRIVSQQQKNVKHYFL